ncbi:MAG: alpha/beta hydrolase [Rhizobiaceae bacterium]
MPFETTGPTSIEPAVLRLIEQRGRVPFVPVTAATAAAARKVPGLMETLLSEGPSLPRVEDLTVDAGGHTVPVRLYHPGADRTGLAVFLHGGGWVRGSVASHDAYARLLAARSGFAVASVDYRLAPEHPFPAALDDCMAVIRWAAERCRADGAARPLAVIGESAGGNLAAVAAILAARQGIPIAAQILIYPVTDHDFDTPSYGAFGQGMLTRSAMENFWDLYAAGHDRDDFRLSPLRAADLAGAAPAFILTGGLDALRDEGEAYGALLEAAGVPARVKRYEALPHGFIAMEGISTTARQANDDIVSALRDLHRPG